MSCGEDNAFDGTFFFLALRLRSFFHIFILQLEICACILKDLPGVPQENGVAKESLKGVHGLFGV